MYFRQFRIKNFKGISEVTIDLNNNRIITLVGLNESGKTTIMEAIQFFYNAVKGKEPSASQLNQIRPKGHAFTGDIEIEASLFLEEEDVERLREHWKSLGHKKKELIIGNDFTYTFKFSFRMHEHKETTRTPTWSVKELGASKELKTAKLTEYSTIVQFVKKELMPEILYYSDFIFEIPEEISFDMGDEDDEEVSPASSPSVSASPSASVSPSTSVSVSKPRALSAEEKKNRDWQWVLDDILKSVDDRYSSFEDEVAALWLVDNDTASNRKSMMETQLNQKITTAWKALFQQTDKKLHFKEIALKCEPDTESNQLKVSFVVKTDTGKVFSINDRSKGCKWFFSFLLFTEFRKNRTKNILFLLDEPASNLHSSAQAKILDAIDVLSEKAFVIYSTHSHHLIRLNWLPGVYVVINEVLTANALEGNLSLEEGASISAKRYYHYVAEGLGSDKMSYIQPILDALDYQPSTLEPTPELIVTEGRNDWYTFTYFNDVLMGGKHTMHLYPGAGGDKLFDIIRLYLSWGKKFIVLLDGDKPGEKAKELYLKEFGDLLKDRVFTINDALGKAVATEGLIEEADQEAIVDEALGKGSYAKLKSSAPDAKKSSLNRAISQLLVGKKKATLGKGTTGTFDKLFGFVTQKLSEVKL